MNIAAAGHPASISAAFIGATGSAAMVSVPSVFADVVNMTLAAAPAAVAAASVPMTAIAGVHIDAMRAPAQAALPKTSIATEPAASSVVLLPGPTLQVPATLSAETHRAAEAPSPATPIEVTPVPFDPAQSPELAYSKPAELLQPSVTVPVATAPDTLPGKRGNLAEPAGAVSESRATPVPQVAAAEAAPQPLQTAELPPAVREVRAARPVKIAAGDAREDEPPLEIAAPAAATPPVDPQPVAALSTAISFAAADDYQDVAAGGAAVAVERAKTADFGGDISGTEAKSAAPAPVEQTLAAPQFSAFVKEMPGATALPPATAQSAYRVAAAPPVPVIDASSGQVGYQTGVAIARRISDGGNELLVRLDPPALGRIEVRISFDDSGSLRAVVAADSPVALDLLRRESGELGRALADAGVRADAQSLRFDSRGGEGGQPRERYYNGGAASLAESPAPGIDEPAYQPLRWQRQLDLLA